MILITSLAKRKKNECKISTDFIKGKAPANWRGMFSIGTLVYEKFTKDIPLNIFYSALVVKPVKVCFVSFRL